MALPKFEDWQAPWEASGKELDPEQIKKHHYNVLSDKEKAQTARDTALGEVTTLTSKVAELQAAAEKKSTEGLSEIEKLTASVEALTKRAETAEFEKTKLDVITAKELDPKASKFLKGTTQAELEASADELLELGLGKKSEPGEKEGKVDEQGNPIVTQPVVKTRTNSGDPAGGAPKELPSQEEFLKRYDADNASVF